jgi:hypothetical protein
MLSHHWISTLLTPAGTQRRDCTRNNRRGGDATPGKPGVLLFPQQFAERLVGSRSVTSFRKPKTTRRFYLLLMLLVGYLSYRFIEGPFLKLRRRYVLPDAGT